MPDCPDCHVMLTFILAGAQCDRCARYFTVDETIALPGFDFDNAVLSHDILDKVMDLGFPPGTTFRVFAVPGGFGVQPILPAERQVFSVN